MCVCVRACVYVSVCVSMCLCLLLLYQLLYTLSKYISNVYHPQMPAAKDPTHAVSPPRGTNATQQCRPVRVPGAGTGAGPVSRAGQHAPVRGPVRVRRVSRAGRGEAGDAVQQDR